MQYKFLKNGFKVSVTSFGCMSLEEYGIENDYLIGSAIDNGINLFDTADLYNKGENEILLGKALGNNRKKILLATKVGNRWRADGSGWDWIPTKEYILEAVDHSLRRLNTDYIDLYQLHGGTLDDPQDEIIEAFERLKDMGKIRDYGISSIRPNVIRSYVSYSNIVSVMTQYSLLDRRPEEEVLQLLEDHKIGVLARGTLASGLLAGKPAASYLSIKETEVRNIQRKVIKLAPVGKTPAETAIRYVADHPAVTTAVVGVRTSLQLDEMIDAGSLSPLTEKKRSAIAAIWTGNKYEQHR